MTATIADGWREEGIAIGEAKGEARGEARGQAKGKFESMLLVLESRFGEVPVDLQKRLLTMQDGGRIEKMIKLAATCRNLKEFESGL